MEKNWIAIWGHIPSLNFHGCLINIYNPCGRKDRALIWDYVALFWEDVNIPSLIFGDFNEVLGPLDRGSNLVSQAGVPKFHNFMQQVHLTKIQAKNGWFTWHKGPAKSKINRLLVNPEWVTVLPSLEVSVLKRFSDHSPLLVRTDTCFC